jgi:ATP-dependent Lon protease
MNKTLIDIPVLPLRDIVVYPHMVIPLYIGRLKSIKALDEAMLLDKQILLVLQKDSKEDDPKPSDFYQTGTLVTILQMLKLPDGTLKVLVEGNHRAKIENWIEKNNYFMAHAEVFLEEELEVDSEIEGLIRTALSLFDNYNKLSKKVPAELLTSLSNMGPGRLTDTIAAHVISKLDEKQEVLECQDIKERIKKILKVLEREIDILGVERRVKGRVERQMKKTQREYYLSEQMKAIQKELGRERGEGIDEFEQLEKKIKEAKMPEEAEKKALSELEKFRMMPPMSAEATVSRSYLDTLLALPWNRASKLNLNLKIAQKKLDQDHYGLEKIKERILEYLAVQQRIDEQTRLAKKAAARSKKKQKKAPKKQLIEKKAKASVLCFVGPPGVGKTSLGQSIAKATGREFVRMSLGGVRDEAEIRGHRRTYIGSLPGKIMQKIKKADVSNPLFMLDEIDKMAMDFRGDPASALLEVLDPEQNYAFGDHYLEVDFDLSNVLFICTANSLNIPPALLDRMEVIRIPGYTEDEKTQIAFNYLIPDQLESNRLSNKELAFSPGSVKEIIRYYTREAGVRNLDRQIATICRKVVKDMIMSSKKRKMPLNLTVKNVEKYLGVHQYHYGLAGEKDQIGLVTGLAWTEVGGELLKIETVVLEGKGHRHVYTGRLGEVMQESILAAVTVVRSRAQLLGISPDFYEHKDIHIHVPEGATPKDGPSAGIAMCTGLVSALTQIPVRSDVAMTGEVTLRGQVLGIGGLKEKLLAALRGGIKTVIIPKENEKDLKEMPKNILKNLNIHAVEWVDQVFEIALTELPKPKPQKKKAKAQKRSNKKTSTVTSTRDQASLS